VRPLRVFSPVITAVLLVMLGGWMAIQLGRAGSKWLPSLNTPTPVIGTISTPRTPPPPRLTRRVVLVIMDGMRLRESYRLRYLSTLRRVGIDAKASSHYPSFSRPNYVTIVTGVPPRFSGVRSNDFDLPVALDSIMDRVRDAGMDSSYVGDVSAGLPVMFTAPVFRHYYGSPIPRIEFENDFAESFYVRWPGGFADATRILIERRHALVVLLPGAVDEAGHEYGADEPEYMEAARSVDDSLRRGLESVDLDKDTIIVVADHGHTDAGGHGGTEPEVMTVPLVMAGAGIRPGAAVEGARLIDIAPTVCALLGLPPPRQAMGRVLVDALVLDRATKKRITAGDAERVFQERFLINASRRAAARQVNRRRVWRFGLVFGLLAIAIALMVVARRVDAVHFDWRVLLIAVPAFPATYYALLGALGQQYSPSFIPERGDVVSLLFRFGVASTVVHIIAGWIALRGRVILRNRLAAANAITIFGLVASWLPAGLAWAYYPGPFVEVPGEAAMVLVPATYIAVASYAMAAAVTLGLELVIFFARAVDPRRRLRRLEQASERERRRLQTEDWADNE
jgi:hypothetical protein